MSEITRIIKMSSSISVYLLLGLTLFTFGMVVCKIQVIDDTQYFRIYYNDVLIIYHNIESFPVMEVGVGNFEASDHLGNWKINDTVSNKIALDLYELGKANSNLLFVNRHKLL